MSDPKIYAIPARFRRVENMHILLWLIKDACWATSFRTLGIIMIVPTLTVAIVIAWQTRKMLSEFLHNLAVIFWISANCLWMVGEFFGWETAPGVLLSVPEGNTALRQIVWGQFQRDLVACQNANAIAT